MATLSLLINAQGAQAGANQFKAATDQIKNHSKEASQHVENIGRTAESAAHKLAHVFAIAGVGIGLHAIAHEFLEFETGLIRVGKTSGIAGDDLQNLGDQFIKMSTEMPFATHELMEIGFAAGQLGVHGAANILAFTETVAKLGTTGNLKGEEAAMSLARILNLTREGNEKVKNLASTIVQVAHGSGDVHGSAATEAEIAHTTVKIAQATSPYGIKSADVVALAASFASVGVEAQVAATSTGKLLRTFDEAVRSGSGLGSKLNEIAEISGMSATEFQNLFKADSATAMAKFVEGLGKFQKAGGNAVAVLRDLKLDDERLLKAILPLAKGSEDLVARIGLARKEFSAPMRLDLEASKQVGTLASQFKILGNTITGFFTLNRGQADPLRAFLQDFNQALQISLGLRQATDQTTPAVKRMVDIMTMLGKVIKIVVEYKIAKWGYEFAASLYSTGASAFKLIASMWQLIAIAAVFIAAWEIGKYLRSEFKIVQQAADELVIFMLSSWENIKLAALLMWDAIKLSWEATVAAIKLGIAVLLEAFADPIAMLSSIVPGMDEVSADHIKKLASTIRADSTTAVQAITDDMNRHINEWKRAQDALMGARALMAKDRDAEFANKKPRAFMEFLQDEGRAALDIIDNMMEKATGFKFRQVSNLRQAEHLQDQGNKAHDDAEGGTPADLKANPIQAEIDKLTRENELLHLNNTERKAQETIDKLIVATQDQKIEGAEKQLDQVRALIRESAKLKATQDIDKSKAKIEEETRQLQMSDDARERAVMLQGLIAKHQEEGVEFTQAEVAALQTFIDKQLQIRHATEQINNIAKGIGDAFGKAFESAILDAKSFADVFKGLMQDIQRTVIHEMFTVPLTKSITGALSSSGGGLLGGILGMFKSANGSAWDGGNPLPFANGGVVGGPTMFGMSGGRTGLMGEAGPEAILPLRRGADGRLGVASTGGGSTTIVQQTINISTPNADSFRKSQRQIMAELRKGTK